ncbi:DUF4190 domain-containing protein [Microbacterium maritypicum]|uniref:DUF4190 domain-containing protein n=1 Tax=Microbacterium maritypicum TaxID=33918 RepID=UPI003A94C4C3
MTESTEENPHNMGDPAPLHPNGAGPIPQGPAHESGLPFEAVQPLASPGYALQQGGGTSAPPPARAYPDNVVQHNPNPMSPVYAPPRRMNTLAVLCLFLAPLFGVVGIMLGIIAQVQIERTGERGKGLAIAGIIVGAVSTAMIIVFGIVIAGSLPNIRTFPDPDTTAPSSSGPSNYGDDEYLDMLWDECDDGNFVGSSHLRV